MKKKILIIAVILLTIIIGLIILLKVYTNTIQDDWILAISPIYLNEPSNTVYIYDNSFIITKSFAENKFDLIYKRGKLTSNFSESWVSMLKSEEYSNDNFTPWYEITLNSGEIIYLGFDNISIIYDIVDLMDYHGPIWYVNDYTDLIDVGDT